MAIFSKYSFCKTGWTHYFWLQCSPTNALLPFDMGLLSVLLIFTQTYSNPSQSSSQRTSGETCWKCTSDDGRTERQSTS